ncbi:hypothetical protein F5B19DRAFT_160880 [Rostrohypoxylon terebratum]|nr:hypothetical protein F5B19DRAFT_160880 [Rostrohypoxylon terebratum]
MPSLTKITLITLLAATSALADSYQDHDMNNCPGVRFVNSDSGCCVGGTVDAPFLSVCKGWPICEGPTTTTWTATPISCATIVTDGPDYDAQISKARDSLKASGTHLVTPLTGGIGVGVGGTAVSTGAAAGATASPGQSAAATATAAAAGSSATGSAGGSSGGAAATSQGATGAAAGLTMGLGATGGAFMAFVAALL